MTPYQFPRTVDILRTLIGLLILPALLAWERIGFVPAFLLALGWMLLAMRPLTWLIALLTLRT